MPKKAKHDPLKSVTTSKVFFELVPEPKTPNQLSSKLKIMPPSVIEHIRRLQAMGIVKLGEKKGKFQYYQINWRNFVSTFLDTLKEGYDDYINEEIEKTLPDEWFSNTKFFWGNKYFQQLILEYFKEFVNLCFEDYGKNYGWEGDTIYDLIKSFETFLAHMHGDRIDVRTGKKELREFKKALYRWWQFCNKHYPAYIEQDALQRAVEKIMPEDAPLFEPSEDGTTISSHRAVLHTHQS